MIATLRNKIQSVPTTHLPTMLRKLTRYAWVGTGLLFICYSYFVGAITFSVIKQEALQQTTKGLISTMGNQEQVYLHAQQSLTQSYASSIGLIPSTAVAFATAMPALALNVGQ